MLTAQQIILHLVGDYILQNQWMATNKTKSHYAAFIHAGLYTDVFIFATFSPFALFVIGVTHFVIDRWRLARYVIWLSNGASIEVPSIKEPDTYPEPIPMWLIIVVDNTMHLIINGLAIYYL